MVKNAFYLKFVFKSGLGNSFEYYVYCETDYHYVFDDEYNNMSNNEKDELITVELYKTDNNGTPVFIDKLY